MCVESGQSLTTAIAQAVIRVLQVLPAGSAFAGD